MSRVFVLLLASTSCALGHHGPADEPVDGSTSQDNRRDAREPAERSVEIAPHLDRAEARELLARYRAEFEQNREAVHACQRASADECAAVEGCELRWETAGDGISQRRVCRADALAIHAWQQEKERRRCEASREGFWSVHQANERIHGQCKCPAQSLDAFIADGRRRFSPVHGACRTDRQLCEERGGVFRSPSIHRDPEHALLQRARQPSEMPNAFVCRHGSYPNDVDAGLFLYPVWHDGEKRCRLHVLEGFVSTPVSDELDGARAELPRLDTHRCDTD